MVIFGNMNADQNYGGDNEGNIGQDGTFSSKNTDHQWNVGDQTYEIDPVYGYYTYWEMGSDGEWHSAGVEDTVREGSIEMPEGAFTIECSAYDDDC